MRKCNKIFLIINYIFQKNKIKLQKLVEKKEEDQKKHQKENQKKDQKNYNID